jgi:DNA-binding NarL/FixJ family response regulator
VRGLIKRVVSGIATEIVECADGGEALAAYSRSQPDWVLMDIEMERVDGITAMRQITAAFPEARVIIVTNHNHEQHRKAAVEGGARGYVLKENLLDLKRLLETAG